MLIFAGFQDWQDTDELHKVYSDSYANDENAKCFIGVGKIFSKFIKWNFHILAYWKIPILIKYVPWGSFLKWKSLPKV